jgi:DNA-binding protein Fis
VRNNWLFFGSDKGGQTAATLGSITESKGNQTQAARRLGISRDNLL